MMIYNRQFARLLCQLSLAITGLAAAFATSGCVKPRSHGNGALGATFFTDEVTGTAHVNASDPVFMTPKSTLITFKTCLKDRRTQKDIAGGHFILRGPGLEETMLQADEQSCVRWSQSIEFDFLADPLYVRARYELIGQGIHSGTRILDLALNPWAEGDDAVVDLSKSELPEEHLVDMETADATLARFTKSPNDQRRLWLDEVKLIHLREGGLFSKMVLAVVPKVWRRSIEGRKESFSFKAGRYRVALSLLSLIEEGGRTRKYVIAKAASEKVEFKDGLLSFAFDPALRAQILKGQIGLVLSLDPVNGPPGLGGFEGFFPLGNADALSGSKALSAPAAQSNHGGSFSAATILSDSTDFTNPTSPQAGQANPTSRPDHLVAAVPFDLRPIEVKIERAIDRGALSREVEFSLKTCVSDPTLGDKPRAHEKFVVGREDDPGFIRVATTDEWGCLAWEDSVQNIYYQPERYQMRSYSLRSASGETRTRTIVLNPSEDSPFYFGEDSSKKDLAAIKAVSERPLDPARIILPSYQFEKAVTVYSVDPFLNLLVHRRVRLTLSPRVVRPMIRKPVNNIEALRGGVYLLRIAVQSLHREGSATAPVESISTYKRLVLLEDGRIQTGVEFTFRDPLFLITINKIVIDLVPVDDAKVDRKTLQPLSPVADIDSLADESQGLRARTFVGPTVPNDGFGFASLRAADSINDSLCNSMDCDLLPEGQTVRDFETKTEIANFYEAVQKSTSISAKELIARSERSEKEYLARMRAFAEPKKIEKQYNVDYIPLYSLIEKNGNQGASGFSVVAGKNEQVRPSAEANQFIARLNQALPTLYPYAFYSNSKTRIDGAKLEEIVAGRALSGGEKARLCNWWVNDVAVPRSRAVHLPAPSPTNLLRACAYSDDVPRFPVEPFLIERKIHVLVAPQTREGGGSTLDFSVGKSFSYSMGYGASGSFGLSAGGSFSTGAGLVGSVGASANANLHGDIGKSDSVSIGSSLGLHLERKEMLMQFVSYQQCAVVRLNPLFVQRLRTLRVEPFRSLPETSKELGPLLRGVMLCTGLAESTPLAVRERYYYFSQSPDGALLDKQNILNYPWMIGIRGASDYLRFVDLLEARPSLYAVRSKVGNTATKPIELVAGAFKYALPTYPGFYDVIDPGTVPDDL